MKYRIGLSRRRKATGEHVFMVTSISGATSWIQWNSQTGRFKYYGSIPVTSYGMYTVH